MIRTFICKEEGCPGNEFTIISSEESFKISCANCLATYEMPKTNNVIVTPICSSCESEKFKVFMDGEKIFLSCIKCNNPPRLLYLDMEGNQISYKESVFLELQNKNIDQLNGKLDYMYTVMKDINSDVDRIIGTEEVIYELTEKVISILNKKL